MSDETVVNEKNDGASTHPRTWGQVKEMLRDELLRRAKGESRLTYAKLDVGQVVKYVTEKEGWGEDKGESSMKLRQTQPQFKPLVLGEKLLILAFPPKTVKAYGEPQDRFLYCRSMESGRAVRVTVDQILPMAFAETFELFREP